MFTVKKKNSFVQILFIYIFMSFHSQIDYRTPKAPNISNVPTGNLTSNVTLNGTNASSSPPVISTLPGGATSQFSSGRALIDLLFTHPAISADSAGPKGQDGRDLGFMRNALHAIGEKYGFLDLSTPAFSVSLLL